MSATIMAATPDLRSELINWRDRLESASAAAQDLELSGLLREVKSAIDRLSAPESYGVCQVCHDLIGQAAMNADPLAKSCLTCLTPKQLGELDDDLSRAWLIQGESLPKQNFKFNGWGVSYYYEPAGRLSGDYCDLVSTDSGDLYFLIGDVAGKGVAASLLMSRLHAIVRSLISTQLPLSQLIEKANHLFADTTMRPYYATLVCGKASVHGEVEVCNAGHCPPLVMHDGTVSPIAATGLPVGMFCQERYETVRFNLNRGDRLLLYTDGLSEARDVRDEEYGGRIHSLVSQCAEVAAPELVNKLLEDMREFANGVPVHDDLTVMAIEMVGH
ncbi:MAG TPA: PP2C family protein-serine/threonine phosphatase [Pyrinomonadaceae bacterium]|nr:PP2C family protein-serine/threonine phosphatase [Pyrinomonadaceae bacterium]